MKTIVAILAVITGSAPSWACDPGWNWRSIEDEAFAWDIIFDGRIVDVRWQARAPRSLLDWAVDYNEYNYTNISDHARCVVTFRVTENFKGAGSPFYELSFIGPERAYCSPDYVYYGGDLVVANFDSDGAAFAGICDWPLHDQEELRATARRLRAQMLIW